MTAQAVDNCPGGLDNCKISENACLRNMGDYLMNRGVTNDIIDSIEEEYHGPECKDIKVKHDGTCFYIGDTHNSVDGDNALEFLVGDGETPPPASEYSGWKITIPSQETIEDDGQRTSIPMTWGIINYNEVSNEVDVDWTIGVEPGLDGAKYTVSVSEDVLSLIHI